MRRETRAITGLDMFEGVLLLGVKISAALLIAITGYYVFATVMHGNELFRGQSPSGGVMSPQQFQGHVTNLVRLMQVLLLVVIVLSVCTLGRFYSYPEAGGALLVLGALLYLGIPFLVDAAGGQGTLPLNLRRFGDPRAYLKSQYLLAGMIVGGAAIIQLIVHAVLFAVTARSRRPRPDAESAETAKQIRKANDKFLGPCWELPFCRDTDKKLCPIRKERKPCWRNGRGCYCDQNVILTISGGSLYTASRGSTGYLARTATVAKPKTLREKREQCLGCPVYLHHQGQKYKLMAPLLLIGLVGVFVFYWSTLRTIYPNAMQNLGRAMQGFSFGERTGGVPQWAMELSLNVGMQWMLLLVVAMLVIAYLMNSLEWVLFKLGI